MAEKRIACSACGGTEVLHVVTAGRKPGLHLPGRILVYCGKCRRQHWEKAPGSGTAFDVSIPIELMTPDLFVRLYETGWTESEWEFASTLVFGEVPDEVRQRMSTRSGDGTS